MVYEIITMGKLFTNQMIFVLALATIFSLTGMIVVESYMNPAEAAPCIPYSKSFNNSNGKCYHPK